MAERQNFDIMCVCCWWLHLEGITRKKSSEKSFYLKKKKQAWKEVKMDNNVGRCNCFLILTSKKIKLIKALGDKGQLKLSLLGRIKSRTWPSQNFDKTSKFIKMSQSKIQLSVWYLLHFFQVNRISYGKVSASDPW